MCEMPSCYGHELRKARKAHRCCECGGAIQPDEQYHYHHGVWEGEASDHKVCVDCEALREKCDKGVPRYERTGLGELIESLAGVWGHSPELLAEFVAIKQRRGASVPSWMLAKVTAAGLLKEQYHDLGC